jgi:hypothetical protein
MSAKHLNPEDRLQLNDAVTAILHQGDVDRCMAVTDE